ncbi:DUF4293 domain-containing protein [Haoranjiania flava]|uniref:DUF4293 domain-containing protein n=1 Tax=Haoranjiania flava TaxID=1856322 RepID=A0AAE3IQ74_9BACT|nr:DUF4293 domain-containing protein [Haoranjiania flava]MCU7695136.1 DUF4293 domain-containing protein [Haoranjiania flava]
MIQRIQTLWMLIVALLAGLTFQFPFFTGISNEANQGITDVATTAALITSGKLYALSNMALLLVTAAIMVLALVTVFLYKDRKKQLLLCYINLVLSFGLIGLYFYYRNTEFVSGTIAIYSIITFLIPVFVVLAIRGINKDISLLKSVDRLR